MGMVEPGLAAILITGEKRLYRRSQGPTPRAATIEQPAGSA
jgi:hypothetical protein